MVEPGCCHWKGVHRKGVHWNRCLSLEGRSFDILLTTIATRNSNGGYLLFLPLKGVHWNRRPSERCPLNGRPLEWASIRRAFVIGRAKGAHWKGVHWKHVHCKGVQAFVIGRAKEGVHRNGRQLERCPSEQASIGRASGHLGVRHWKGIVVASRRLFYYILLFLLGVQRHFFLLLLCHHHHCCCCCCSCCCSCLT